MTGSSSLFSLHEDNKAETMHNGGRKYSFFETLEGLPMLILLAIVFSVIVITGLWSYSSNIVLDNQDPTLPYVFAFIGYAGMSISALLIGLKLIRGVEHNTNSEN